MWSTLNKLLTSVAKCRPHTVTLLNTRQISSEEISIPVPWGRIAGKWWGSTKIKPILCLHGMQDNCGSFDRLIPILSANRDISFLCLDFPGHGYSSPFPKGMFYDFLSYPILVKRISNYFNWPTISLMGHSLGAMVSFMYTMLYPEKVNFLMCIDALKPVCSPMSAEVTQEILDNFLKYESYKGLEDTVTYTLQEIIQKIVSKKSIDYEHVPLILKRNIAASRKDPGKYYFIRDPILKVRLVFNWPQEQIEKDASRISCPIFMCKAEKVSYFEPKENFYAVVDILKQSSMDFDFHMLDGTHHLHLNEPEKIGSLMKCFLNKYCKLEEIDECKSIFSES
ncbi:hypothetical protein WA026_017286 [Henosepilachna vigintioctopunctata]|uniref:AB hydrolase-1 domain-containing protein n=1 Tax=Henosepilachna vigintioctopunctata TaxID=420089 RepID=A0AAW1UGE1_9CUCU